MVLPMSSLEALWPFRIAHKVVPISCTIDMEVIEEGHICILWLRVSELLTDAGPKLNCSDALDFLMEIFSQINFTPTQFQRAFS